MLHQRRARRLVRSMKRSVQVCPWHAFTRVKSSVQTRSARDRASGKSSASGDSQRRCKRQRFIAGGDIAAEEQQWAQYAQVVRDNAARMEPLFAARRKDVANMTAVDNMRSYADLAQAHADNMAKLATAFQSLYDSFPDQQKKLADSVFRQAYGGHRPGSTKAGVKKPVP